MIIGMGRFGSAVATELFKLGHEVFVIDKLEENITKITDSVTHAIIGNANDESVLSSLGIQNFDCIVVTIAGNIEESVLITLMLKEMGAKKLVCKAQNEQHAKVLSRVGADEVIRPEYDMGKRIAHLLVQKNIIDLIELSADYRMAEISVLKNWVGKTLGENNLRQKFGLTVLAIRSENSNDVKISPGANVVLNKNDILIIVGSNNDLEAIEAIS